MKKLTVLFLCLALIAAFAVAEPGAVDSSPGGDDSIVGNDRDEHGCIGSAGYTWCEEKQKCLRTWEEECASIEAQQIGGSVDEHGCANPKGEFWCEDTQECFMITDEECASFDPDSLPDDNSGQGNGGGQAEVQNQAGAQNGETIRTEAQLRENLQLKEQELAEEAAGASAKEQKVLQNQNQVRLAVHALLGMEDLVGGIGPQVSAIARQFNNSVQATIQAEEKIEARSGIARFFAGGDKAAADEIDAQIAQNQIRLQELQQLKEQCNCSSEVKTLLQEQIQSMETEQARLAVLSANEKGSKGLFGWLWK